MLSENILQKIIKNQDLGEEKPILQIIEIKLMQQESILLIVSDGSNLIEGNLNSSYLTAINNKDIQENMIIKLTDYTVMTVEGRSSLNISSLEPVRLAPKQGNPAPMTKMMQKLSGNYTPINALSTFMYDWTIRAMVTRKSDLNDFTNKKTSKTDKLMVIKLNDINGSQISASFFGEAAQKFHKIIEDGKVYLFSNGNINLADQKFRSTDCNYQLQFSLNANIELDENQSFTVKKTNRKITPLNKLRDFQTTSMVDVIGVVIEVGRLTEKLSKKKGENLVQRILKILDSTETSIEVSLWNELAVNPQISDLVVGESIVYCKSLNIRVYNDTLYLSTARAISEVLVNPENEEATMLLNWYKKGAGQGINITELSLRKEGRENKPYMSIAQIKSMNAGSDKHYAIGVINFPKVEEVGFVYESCISCKKKVESCPDGTFKCIPCAYSGKDCFYKYLIRGMVIGDFTGSLYATAFNDVGELIFKVKADAFNKLSNEEKENKVKSASASKYIVGIRVSEVLRNDDRRIEYTVGSIYPINFTEGTARILNMIQKGVLS